MIKQQPKNDYYMEVVEPLKFRKNVLYCVKDSLRILQEFEKLRTIKDSKEQKAKELKELIGQLNKLINSIKLPNTPSIKKKSASKYVVEKKTITLPTKIIEPIKPINTPPRKKSEIELLEEELNKVEQELAALK